MLRIAAVLLLAAAPADDRVVAALDAWLTAAGQAGYSGAVLLAKDGEVRIRRAFGGAEPANRFDIASVSKSFTAVLVLRLCDRGVLSLDDRLSDRLPGVPSDKAGITLRMLLSHTSGLHPSVNVEYGREDRASMLAEVLGAPLGAPPGTAFAYCNAGYGLVAAMVEVATGRPFEDVLREEVLAPAGLSATCDPGGAAPGRDFLGMVEPRAYGWGIKGAGGIAASADDILALDRALRAGALLSAEGQADLLRAGPSGYALGWFVETGEDGKRLACHGGTVAGSEAMVGRWLEDGWLLVALADRGLADLGGVAGGPDAVFRAFRDILAGRDPATPPRPAPGRGHAAFAGEYALPTGARLVVRSVAGGLSVLPLGQEAFDLLRAVALGPRAAPPAPPLDLAAAGRAAEGFVRALVAREFAVVERSMHPGIPPGWPAEWRRTALEPLEKDLGPARAAELVGSWANGGVAESAVRVSFSDSERVLRVYTEGGRLNGLLFRGDHPGRLVLVPDGKDGAFFHDFGTGTTTRFRFERKAGETALSVGVSRAVRRR